MIASWEQRATVERVIRHLGYLRQWCAGYEAAGGKAPMHADGLRLAQLLLEAGLRDRDGGSAGDAEGGSTAKQRQPGPKASPNG